MTARWSDPHRLPGFLAMRDLGCVRAVTSTPFHAMSELERAIAFLSDVGMPTSALRPW